MLTYGRSLQMWRQPWVGRLLGDSDRDLSIARQRAVVGARAQDVSAWLRECRPHGHLAIRRHRRRDPDRRPWRVGANAGVFPDHNLLGRKRDVALAAVDEPGQMQTDVLADGDPSRRLHRAI